MTTVLKKSPNIDTVMAYKQIRRYAVPYQKIQDITNGGKDGLVDALKQYCESVDFKGGIKANINKKYDMKEIDFDFIAKHWPKDKAWSNAE